jgi:uncharacterized protein (DUF58 family)
VEIAAQKHLPVRIRLPRFPVAVKLTKEGLTFILLSLAIGAAAVNTGNNVLYLIFSLMLGLIVISGIISKTILSGLIPRIEFPDHLFSGVQNVCYVVVSNSKRWLPSIGIRFGMSGPNFPSLGRPFFFISPGSEASGFVSVVFPNRGVFEVGEIALQTHFPFSFFIKIQRFVSQQKVRVYPRIFRFPEEAVLKFTEGTMLDSPYRGDSQQLLHLREYMPQDSSKRIHWKASARSDKLVVKEFQKEQGRDIQLYFDCRPQKPDKNQEAIHEKALSLIASLVFLFVKRGASGIVVFPDAQFQIEKEITSLLPLLDYLAEVKVDGHSPVVVASSSSPETTMIHIRSREIAPVFSFLTAGVRPLFVEDWAHLLVDSTTVQDLKKVVE